MEAVDGWACNLVVGQGDPLPTRQRCRPLRRPRPARVARRWSAGQARGMSRCDTRNLAIIPRWQSTRSFVAAPRPRPSRPQSPSVRRGRVAGRGLGAGGSRAPSPRGGELPRIAVRSPGRPPAAGASAMWSAAAGRIKSCDRANIRVRNSCNFSFRHPAVGRPFANNTYLTCI